MSSVSSSISSLLSTNNDPYTASASLAEDGSIDPASNSVTGNRTSGLFDPKKKELGKDSFLQLLVKQMQFQDPLSPMDNSQFLAQLAQFQSLEGSMNIQKSIDTLNDTFKSTAAAQLGGSQAITNASAVSLIGKEVRLLQTSVYFNGKNPVDIQIHLGNQDSANVEILDEKGNVLKTMAASGKDSQNGATISWDGTNDQGDPVSAGKYAIHVVGSETNADLYAFVNDIASGVRFTKDGALVKVDGKEISVGNIMDVAEAVNSTSDNALSPVSAVTFIGKKIRWQQPTVTFGADPNEKVSIKINMGGQKNVAVNLVDQNGKILTTGQAVAGDDGTATVMLSNQDIAQAGTYRISITGSSNNSGLFAYNEGTVTGVSMVGGTTQIKVNGTTVSLSNIMDISAS